MGLALSPTFSSDRWLYVMHTSPTDNRIVRLRYENGALDTASLQVLVRGILPVLVALPPFSSVACGSPPEWRVHDAQTPAFHSYRSPQRS
ncbi:PQQ-dependent sugar dehydrogenase [Melittangium boletus]|uniref:Uncharacterized protein n=1 Tax=Melittangium boletus DSM 14713 TaxID=1294270 RepID=A0A250IM62_9BACT|nr:PQQ-dependent sugar dehydrogenase [Melittangium boletus]ATB32271.1 hypothetical protein MEBOL_005748 [Melittangium boletus DSM 14713]